MLDGCQSQQYTFTIKDAFYREKHTKNASTLQLAIKNIFAKHFSQHQTSNLRYSLYIKFFSNPMYYDI